MKRLPPRPHVPDRPLDAVTSIKVKLATLIVGAVGITVFVFWFCIRILHIWPSAAGIIAGAVALLMVSRLARGMTSPLREMATATQAMAKGDYSQIVTATSHDEVGRLAAAFNQMAAELAETDRVRRDLVANVSHELRTPLTSLQATLGEPHRRRRAGRSPHAADDVASGRAARAVGHPVARPLPAGGRHGPPRSPSVRGRTTPGPRRCASRNSPTPGSRSR